MTDIRKPLQELMAEQHQHRALCHRNFTSKGDSQTYQVLMLAHSEDTNELQVVYSLCAMPQLKFHMPVTAFLERFEPFQPKAD